MNFSEQIKQIRIRSFMSQNEFAEKLGVAFSTVNRWESGKALPGYKAMKAIDEFCKSNGIPYDILTLKDENND